MALKMTLKEYMAYPKGQRHTMNGKKYIMHLDKRTGATVLTPVVISRK
jgi:hypothetical protein